MNVVSVDEQVKDPIPQAIAAIKANDQAKARAMLQDIIEQDPDNDRAWQWMAIVVETAEEQRQCLHRALSINPNNQVAQQALQRLTETTPVVTVVPAPPTVTIARPPSTALSESEQFLYYYDPPSHQLSSYVIALSLFAVAGFGFMLVVVGSMLPWVKVPGVASTLEQEGFVTLVAGVVGLLAAAVAIWRSGCLSLVGSIAAVSCTLVSIVVAAYNVYYATTFGAQVNVGFIFIVVGGIIALVSSVINSFSGLWMLIRAWSN